MAGKYVFPPKYDIRLSNKNPIYNVGIIRNKWQILIPREGMLTDDMQ